MSETLSPTERRICAGLGISPEQYLARKQEGAAKRTEANRDERIRMLRETARGATASEREAIESQIRQIEKQEED